MNVVFLPHDERMQIAPSEVKPGVVALGIDRALASSHAARHIEQGSAFGSLAKADGLGDGRKDIDEPYRDGDARSFTGLVWEFENERHLNGLAIEKNAMLVLAVIAEAFAVIGHQENRGAIVKAMVL